jgi:hypothetical protein
MKVIEDRVTVYPPHAICRADVRAILSAPPPEWVADIETVRLSAAHPYPHVAVYNRFDYTLTITSRGHTKEHTLDQIFTELAAHGLGILFRAGHRLPARDVSRVQRVVLPLVEQALPLLSRKKVWLDR